MRRGCPPPLEAARLESGARSPRCPTDHPSAHPSTEDGSDSPLQEDGLAGGSAQEATDSFCVHFEDTETVFINGGPWCVFSITVLFCEM
jgi:hypothetical protein